MPFVFHRFMAVFVPRDFLRDPFVRVCLDYVGGIYIPLRKRGCVLTAGANIPLLCGELFLSPPPRSVSWSSWARYALSGYPTSIPLSLAPSIPYGLAC